MKISQKEYTLNFSDLAFDDSNINLDNIILKLNNNLTNINLGQLFLKLSNFKIDKNKSIIFIKGWSILENLKENKLIIKDKEILFNFYLEDNILELKSIKNPLFILNDINISEENLIEFENKILELAEDKIEEELKEEVIIEKVIYNNNRFNNIKEEYIKENYKFYEFKNFKLLKKEDKVILFEIIDETLYKKYNDYEKVIDNFYKFNYNDNILEIKIINKDITVNQNILVSEVLE